MTTAKSLATKTLVNWVVNKKSAYILDIRTQSQRDEWHIPNSHHIDIIQRIKEGKTEVLDNLKIDPEVTVVVVCESGNMSQKAADILSDKGYDAYSLEKGMKAWNYAYDSQAMIFDQFKIIQIRRVAKGCLSYIIGSRNEAIVIDASLDPLIYINLAEEEGWKVKFVTDTHIHADYVSRSRELAGVSKAEFLMNSLSTVDYSYIPLKDGEILKFGDSQLKVMNTPGHTWESTSFIIDDSIILTGDTLFTDGIGRPDLKSDDQETLNKTLALYQSLMKIKSLADATLLFPAHASKSIEIGQAIIVEDLQQLQEKIPALNFSKESFVDYIRSKNPETPPNYLTIAKINKSGKIGTFKISDLEAGSNHCAIE